MLEFLAENYGSFIAGAIVIAIVVLIVLKMIKDKRAGKSSCGGDCSACGGHCNACSGCTIQDSSRKNAAK